jgi:excisionase family DNA binding protein
MTTTTLDQVVEAIAARVAERLAELQLAQSATSGEASPWMNIETAAAYLDWPKQRLYKLTAQGAIPHYKHDGRLLFHRHELDQWLASHRQSGDWINPANRAISA